MYSYSVWDLGQMRPCASMWPLTWALKEVETLIDFQLYHCVWNRSEQNALKFKIASHKQKSIVQFFLDMKIGPLANGSL